MPLGVLVPHQSGSAWSRSPRNIIHTAGCSAAPAPGTAVLGKTEWHRREMNVLPKRRKAASPPLVLPNPPALSSIFGARGEMMPHTHAGGTLWGRGAVRRQRSGCCHHPGRRGTSSPCGAVVPSGAAGADLAQELHRAPSAPAQTLHPYWAPRAASCPVVPASRAARRWLEPCKVFSSPVAVMAPNCPRVWSWNKSA